MTVWQLACELIRLTLRGRGRQPVYVHVQGLPDELTDAIEAAIRPHDLEADRVEVYEGDRFAVLVASPETPRA